MEHTSMDLGSRENFSNTLPYASFKICCKQGYSRGDGRHFTMVWNTAIRWPFCSPSHVSRTSGQILRELVWCGLRFWCKHEWTSVEQMASWRVWRSHLQTTVWRWQGPPTAALCGKHHMPPVLHPNIFLEESCFNEVLCKLQNYITITIQYLKGLIIGIQTLKFGGGGSSSSLWAPLVEISGDAYWPLCWEVQDLFYWPLALLGHSSPPWFPPRWS